MGEGNSKPIQNQPYVQNFAGDHSRVQEGYDDPRIGRVNIYKSNSTQEYVAVKKSFSHNKEQVETCSTRLAQAMEKLSQCPFLLRVLGYDLVGDQSMCGSVSEMSTFLEYYLNNLEAEIQQRQQSGLFYSEQELWVILYSCISSVNFLAKFGSNINDIRPQNIYITPNGQLKLVPFELFPDDMTGYLKVQHFNDQCYISPEQLTEVKNGKANSSKDRQKSDIYAVGLTMLQCSTLNSSVDCYDWDELRTRPDIIEQRLGQLKEKYSRFYSNMIKILLDPVDETRPSSEKIAQVLEPYEQQILNLQPFTPNQEIIQQHLNNPNEVPIQQQSQIHTPQPQFQQPYQQQPPQEQQYQQPVHSQYAPQPQLNQSQVQYQYVDQQPQQIIPQQPPLNTSQVMVQPTQSVIPQNQPVQQSYAPQQQQQPVPIEQVSYVPPQQTPYQQPIQSGVYPAAQETVNVQPKPVRFEDLPPEVQQQIQRGEKGSVQAPTTATSSYQPVQPSPHRVVEQHQPATTYAQQPPTTSNLPQNIGGYQQVSQPPPEIVNNHGQLRSYDPQSPIRLVQGPTGHEEPATRVVENAYQPVETAHVHQPATNNYTYQAPATTSYQPVQHVEQHTTTAYPEGTYQTSSFPQQHAHYSPKQDSNEMSDIDRRINDVLTKTKTTLERADQQARY